MIKQSQIYKLKEKSTKNKQSKHPYQYCTTQRRQKNKPKKEKKITAQKSNKITHDIERNARSKKWLGHNPKRASRKKKRQSSNKPKQQPTYYKFDPCLSHNYNRYLKSMLEERKHNHMLKQKRADGHQTHS